LHRVAAVASIAIAFGWDRLVLVLAIIAATTALAMAGKIDPAAPVSIMTACLGYAFGASAPGTTQAAHAVMNGRGDE
jgi:hypothetical protein